MFAHWEGLVLEKVFFFFSLSHNNVLIFYDLFLKTYIKTYIVGADKICFVEKQEIKGDRMK